MKYSDKMGKERWLKSLLEGGESSDHLDTIWDKSVSYKDAYEPNVEKGLSSLKAKMAKEKGAKVVPLFSRRNLLRVAALFALISASFFLFNQIDSDAGLVVLNSEDEKLGEYALSDGSSISLNKNSQLSFPEEFEADQRKVKLSGEGFFDVAKDSKRPFTIEAGDAIVTVLGTSFNVRSHEEEDFIEVFVKTGQVEVSVGGTNAKVVLNPLEKAVYDKVNKKLSTSKPKSQNDLAWKTQKLSFINTPLIEVLAAMERYFEVDFVIENEALKECEGFTTKFENLNIEDVKEGLEKVFKVQIESSQNEYLIKGGHCPN